MGHVPDPNRVILLARWPSNASYLSLSLQCLPWVWQASSKCDAFASWPRSSSCTLSSLNCRLRLLQWGSWEANSSLPIFKHWYRDIRFLLGMVSLWCLQYLQLGHLDTVFVRPSQLKWVLGSLVLKHHFYFAWKQAFPRYSIYHLNLQRPLKVTIDT